MKISESKCLKCGMCCRAIVVKYSIPEIKSRDFSTPGKAVNSDKEFVLENWTSISREEALQRNAELESVIGADYFYECKMLDTKTNLCKCYNDRPWACSGFPWYDESNHNPKKLYWSGCGYLEEEEK